MTANRPTHTGTVIRIDPKTGKEMKVTVVKAIPPRSCHRRRGQRVARVFR